MPRVGPPSLPRVGPFPCPLWAPSCPVWAPLPCGGSKPCRIMQARPTRINHQIMRSSKHADSGHSSHANLVHIDSGTPGLHLAWLRHKGPASLACWSPVARLDSAMLGLRQIIGDMVLLVATGPNTQDDGMASPPKGWPADTPLTHDAFGLCKARSAPMIVTRSGCSRWPI